MTSLNMCSPTCESTADNGSVCVCVCVVACTDRDTEKGNRDRERRRDRERPEREGEREEGTVHENDVATRVHSTGCNTQNMKKTVRVVREHQDEHKTK